MKTACTAEERNDNHDARRLSSSKGKGMTGVSSVQLQHASGPPADRPERVGE